MRILLIHNKYDFANTFLGEVEKQYIVDSAYNAEDGVSMSEVTDYDAIVVNIPTNKENPVSDNFYEICKATRNVNVKSPILVLSDRENVDLQIKVLNDGADACIYKPIQEKQLSAQINALVRRSSGVCSSNKITCGKLVLDQDNKTVIFKGKTINFRKKEFELLEYLAINKNKLVLKEVLLEHVWDEGVCVNSNSLEVHIRSIRKKLLENTGLSPIKTLKGIGYRLDC